MANEQSYEEAQAHYKQVMGEQLGQIYHLLWNQCAFLHMRFEEFVELFGKSEKQFDIMNETAPGFFRAVQDMYWESILLGLCRFADGWKMSGRETLSLDQLPRLKGAQPVPGLVELVATARDKIKFAQDWRNRWIAHADLHHALDQESQPLAAASRAQVHDALAAIVDVLNALEWHFTGGSLMFMGTRAGWNGTYLLRQLHVASVLQDEREQRISSGTPREDDYDYKKWRGEF